MVKDLISPDVLLQLAKRQNKHQLYDKFENIEYISDTYNGSKKLSIYVKDNDIQGIPKSLTVRLNEETKLRIRTDIIENSEIVKSHHQIASIFGQAVHNIAFNQSADFRGSICCLVYYNDPNNSKENYYGIVTAGHIFTKNTVNSYGGKIQKLYPDDTLIDGVPKGNLDFQLMQTGVGIEAHDIAIVKIKGKLPLPKFKLFPNGFYQCTQNDVAKQKQVGILSNISRERYAFIHSINRTVRFRYRAPQPYDLSNVIVIGSSRDFAQSRPVSRRGDSGGCVFDPVTDKLIGILIGEDPKFSYVLPIENILVSNNFNLVGI